MSISFSFEENDVIWTQHFQSPTVYLDTFAIRAISESAELSARFARCIQGQKGTWLLSALSSGEFARFADPRHAERAEQLLAQVVPHIYLFLSEPDAVRLGRGAIALAKRLTPPADHRIMDYFARRWSQTQSFPETFEGMFQMVYEDRAKMGKNLDEVASKIMGSLDSHRRLELYRRKAKAARPDDGRTRKQVIGGELLRELVLDISAPITTNEALDLMHAVYAVDYCDLVLLDKAWERRINGLHNRIAKADIDMPIARGFSMHNFGIERFLSALEQWPDLSPPPALSI